MDVDLARRLLVDGDYRERLSAARYLLGRAGFRDRYLIETAAKREDDQYVRSALLRLLVSLPHDDEADAVVTATDDTGASVDERSAILRELTDELTHEVATVVGTLRHYASRELEGYATSDTKRELERLDAVLAAMRQLGDAAAPPIWDGIDLAREATGIVQAERLVHDYELLLTDGPSPHLVTASQGLIALFLRNAISNAVEATLELHGRQRPVVVAWGTDDQMHWIAVLDEGGGPAGSQEMLAKTGASTKDGHPGMGLTIATQVATSLEGDLTLSPQERGGAVCRLAWPRRDAAQ